MLSADNFCKQFGPRSGLTGHQASSGSKLFDTQILFMKYFFVKIDFEKNQQTTKKREKELTRVKTFLAKITVKLQGKKTHIEDLIWVLTFY